MWNTGSSLALQDYYSIRDLSQVRLALELCIETSDFVTGRCLSLVAQRKCKK